MVLSQCRDLTAVAESRLQREAGDTNVVAAIGLIHLEFRVQSRHRWP
ncbi:hypothetical protein CGMCC3_g6994 [Colletotrichum fructicola]|nr:uncharacterized protein CGMCC3_g6994 [Colletotrichum fructicola]KAE9577111.1 hypothetical protein CGMCC3_g6994 [Colletotrichum fructicola]